MSTLSPVASGSPFPYPPPELKVLCLIGDLFGCYTYRLEIPHNELKRFNVSTQYSAFLPAKPGVNQFQLLVDEYSKYDMVIIQRCYLREIVNTVRAVTDFIGIPLIFEVDDLYTAIPRDNPAYLSMVPKDIQESGDAEKIEESRIKGLVNYCEILGMMDAVICSTEELANTIRIHNKNVFVLHNNVEEVFGYKSYDPEHLFVQDGQVVIPNQMGMVTIPSYVQLNEESISPTPRIGWTSTVTHYGSDFDTIKRHWEKVIEKYSPSCWFVYIGWERFVQWHMEYSGMKYNFETNKWEADPTKRQLPRRVMHIPEAMYKLYMFHIRNLDIGIAPLAPNFFNMSKSDLKAIEYGAWGVPAVLPRFITYSRTWKDGENCLMYSNGFEFQECMDTLINDHAFREKLGQAAYKYVKENRLERHHALKRYELYQSIINTKRRLPHFRPEAVHA